MPSGCRTAEAGPGRRTRIIEAVTDLVINPRETGFVLLDFQQLFGNRNPVVVEIGSGKGRFLIASAMEKPDQNFLGIEKSLHYHRVIRERVAKRGLRNVPLINDLRRWTRTRFPFGSP